MTKPLSDPLAPPDRPERTSQVMKVKGACPTCGYLPPPEPFKTDQEIDEAFSPPTVGEVWKASDGRRLRVVGHGRNGRIACRNAETNRLSYIQRRYFHGATDGNWSLQRETPGDVAVPARAHQLETEEKKDVMARSGTPEIRDRQPAAVTDAGEQ